MFLPMYTGLKRLFGIELYYAVVGGWLPEFAEKDSRLTGLLKSLDGIFVETRSMQTMLGKLGINNVKILPNFKRIQPLKTDELAYQTELPLKLCTFSRVMEEKGIGDAIRAVTEINTELKRNVYSLDIYGKVDSAYEEEFGRLITQSGECVRYKGCVPPSDSTAIIKEYFMLLLPTRFKTEGFPGTAIDAFCAGVPTLVSRWDSCGDIIEDNYNGMIFDFCDIHDMKSKLIFAMDNIDVINNMKSNCIKTAQNYLPENVITKMLEEMQAHEV